MFSPLYLKIFEKSPFLMKTPTQNFAHHTEVKKHPFGVKTPILATLRIKVFVFVFKGSSKVSSIFFAGNVAFDKTYFCIVTHKEPVGST